jgi:hypothetical protein
MLSPKNTTRFPLGDIGSWAVAKPTNSVRPRSDNNCKAVFIEDLQKDGGFGGVFNAKEL